MPGWWRRVRRHFGISAPRMAVRTHLPWWGRGALGAGAARDHRRHVVVGLRLRPDLRRLQPQGDRGRASHRSRPTRRKLRAEAIDLRRRNCGARVRARDDARARRRRCPGRRRELSSENAAAQGRARVPAEARVRLEQDGGPADPAARRRAGRRRHVALQRAHRPRRQPEGRIRRQRRAPGHASPVPRPGPIRRSRPSSCPRTSPRPAPALKLKFKYYQRVEGRFRGSAGRPRGGRGGPRPTNRDRARLGRRGP